MITITKNVVKYSILPLFLFFALFSSDCLAKCKKFALVIDTGDQETFWGPALADNMADDADLVEDWLDDNGFDVRRVSQYHYKRPYLSFKLDSKWLALEDDPNINTDKNALGRARKLEKIISNYAKDLKCTKGAKCCHEFFFYMASHGNKDGFCIYPRFRSRRSRSGTYSSVGYEKLAKWLGKLPHCVKFTIFIDACEAGGAIPYLEKLCKTHGKCGVTIITSSDEKTGSYSGDWSFSEPGFDSATADFFEGADEDNDSDGDKGDIRDRWLEMKHEIPNTSPQMKMCGKQTRMCSLEKIKKATPKKTAALVPAQETKTLVKAPLPTSAPVVATVQVRQEEKVQVAGRWGSQVVTGVFVNDERQDIPDPGQGTTCTVDPGDVISLISGLVPVVSITCAEEGPEVLEPSPVVECPPGETTVMEVPHNSPEVPISDCDVSLTNTETGTTVASAATGLPSVSGGSKGGQLPSVAGGDAGRPGGEVTPEGTEVASGGSRGQPGESAGPGQAPRESVHSYPIPEDFLQALVKTSRSVLVAGQLGNSTLGNNKVTVTNRKTGNVLGETEVKTWRLVGASLNPPVVNKGQQTTLRLKIFGPPEMLFEVRFKTDKGLTPREGTVKAPIGVLQSQGLGSFTATEPGQHTVSVQARPAL
ncbi:MAG: hypothetical protein ACYSRP_06085 [Planctomycetota bacterium]|jgi:hypothetical protein